ncbi:hypothetical protein D7Y61_02065 [Stenotrophomonas maltophilia]|nr:hypothetical protein [Stenotrophomonas maltophilia]
MLIAEIVVVSMPVRTASIHENHVRNEFFINVFRFDLLFKYYFMQPLYFIRGIGVVKGKRISGFLVLLSEMPL